MQVWQVHWDYPTACIWVRTATPLKAMGILIAVPIFITVYPTVRGRLARMAALHVVVPLQNLT